MNMCVLTPCVCECVDHRSAGAFGGQRCQMPLNGR